jgi:hypothetical protein
VPLRQAVVCAKTRSIFNDLKGGDSDANSFTASHGWLSNFKARHGFKNVKMSGESASADFEATEKFPEELRDIEEGGFTAEQVFNVDETGLYWKKMPDRKVSIEENTTPGFKAAKDWLTLLLGGNAEGDFKLKPLVL